MKKSKQQSSTDFLNLIKSRTVEMYLLLASEVVALLGITNFKTSRHYVQLLLH